MKKYMILLAALLNVGRAAADEVTISDVTVPQGGQATVCISLSNPDNTYTAGQMLLVLPTGVTAVLNGNGDPTITKGERLATTNHSIGASHLEDGTDQFTIFSISNDAIPSTDGTLFSVCVTADASLTVGTVLEGRLENIELTTTDATPTPFNSLTFAITIGEPADSYVVLNENATTMPVAEEGADVRVKRTLAADTWTTICLPFAMTEEQAREAFGEGVKLADFTRWTSEEDGEGDIVCLNMYFETVTAMEANHPYMIKLMEDMTEFTVDGVAIAPEEEPSVQVGKKKAERGYMIGSYTVKAVPEEALFIDGNEFCYSDGQQEQLALRAWFELNDILSDKESPNVRLYIDDKETGIVEIHDLQFVIQNGTAIVHDLQGRRWLNGKHPKGVYIVGGKKVSVR